MSHTSDKKEDRTAGKAPRLVPLISGFIALFTVILFIRLFSGCSAGLGYIGPILLSFSLAGLGVGILKGPQGIETRGWAVSFSFRLFVTCLLAATVAYLGTDKSGAFLGVLILTGHQEGPIPGIVVYLAAPVLMSWLLMPAGSGLYRSISETGPEAKLAITAGALLSLFFMGLAAWFSFPLPLLIIAYSPFLWFISGNLRMPSRGRILSAALPVIAAAIIFVPTRGSVWSPYQRIEIKNVTEQNKKIADSLSLYLDGEFTQYSMIMDPVLFESPGSELTPARVKLRNAVLFEGTPYLVRPPGKTLILWAGAGNEAAVALSAGVEQVTVVEPDRALLKLTGESRLDNPYADKRVRAVAEDPRKFVLESKDRFDHIIIGWPYPANSFSPISPILSEDLFFTREIFHKLAGLLSADGVVVLLREERENALAARKDYLFKERFRQTAIQLTGNSPVHDRLMVQNIGGQGLARYNRTVPSNMAEKKFREFREEMPYTSILRPYLHRHSKYFKFTFVIQGLLVFAALGAVSIPSYKHVDSLKGKFILGMALVPLLFNFSQAIAFSLGSSWKASYGSMALVIALLSAGTILPGRAKGKIKFILLAVIVLSAISGFLQSDGLFSTEPYVLTGIVVLFASPLVIWSGLALGKQAGDNIPGGTGMAFVGAAFGGIFAFWLAPLGVPYLYLISAFLVIIWMLVEKNEP